MIIDYKNNKDFAVANGLTPKNSRGETHFVIDRVVRDKTFRNIAILCLEEMCFENCTFENCEKVSAESCRLVGCTFRNVNNVEGDCSDFENCLFTECHSDGPFVIIDSHGHVVNCLFDTVTACGEDGYLVCSVYGKKHEVEMIKGCTFTKCHVENECGQYCYCEYFKPFSSFKTVEIDNVDYDTCEGVL